MRVATEVSDVISQPIFDRNSVIILNAGLHYLESTNFTNYQKSIDAVIRLFQEGRTAGGDFSFPGNMIWKTTTALNKQKLDGKHLTSRRFLTFQVRFIEREEGFSQLRRCFLHKIISSKKPLLFRKNKVVAFFQFNLKILRRLSQLIIGTRYSF